MNDLREVARDVIAELGEVVVGQSQTTELLHIDQLAQVLSDAGRVLVFGAGRSGAIALALAQRLNHVGVDAARAGEAGNRRLGPGDAIVVISGSGATASAVAIVDQAAEAAVSCVALMTATPNSLLGRRADLVCEIRARAKGSAQTGRAPYTAQFDIAALAVSEAVCASIMDLRGMRDEEIETWRPNVE